MSRPVPSPAAARIGGLPLVVLALVAAVSPIATDLYLPGFIELGDDLGVGATQVQLTLTAFLVGMACGQLVMGPVSDRFGRRGPLLLSIVVCIVAGAVAALAPTIGILVVARLVQGFTGAGGMVIGRAVVSDLVTGREAARAFTLMMTIGGVAPVVAPVAGSLLIAPLGWRGLLWLVVGMCVVMLVGVLAVLPESLPRARRSGGGSSFLREVGTVVARPTLWAPWPCWRARSASSWRTCRRRRSSSRTSWDSARSATASPSRSTPSASSRSAR